MWGANHLADKIMDTARRNRREERTGPVVAVGGQRDGEGWKVELLQAGEHLAALSAEQARTLAAELLDMAEVIEGRRW